MVTLQGLRISREVCRLGIRAAFYNHLEEIGFRIPVSLQQSYERVEL